MTSYKGIGGGKSGAVIRGRVFINGDNSGDVLLAEFTSVDMLDAMRRAKAVVTMVGGPLSHAAIVCSEWGVPYVVGCGYDLRAIRRGTEVEVDVDAGTVTVLG